VILPLDQGRFGSLAFLALFTLLGCGGRDFPATDIVAQIGEVEVPYSDFEQYLMDNSVALEAGLSSEVLSSLFDQFLEEKLLHTMAIEIGIATAKGNSREAVRMLVEDAAPRGFSLGEIAAYYDAHREEFEVPERVRLRQILVEERTTAEQALAQLASGAQFEDVARQLSNGPGAERGGYQGELTRSDLPPAFAEIIFELDPGETSEIVPADYGFHIFRVVERLPAQDLSLAESSPRIEVVLEQASALEAYERLARDARSRYNVVLYVRNLPFNYVGEYE
jgi:parvulin-like peptidyl-prolyl isomerase